MARETAAAAIAVRQGEKGPEVCLFQAQGEQWSLPWALVSKGEVPKQTALRALNELAGVQAGLTDVDPKFYKTIEQVYRKGIDKLRREVHFFKVRASPQSGTDRTVWLPATEAAQKVTSKAVREVLQHALGLVPPPAPKGPPDPSELFPEE